MCVVLVRRFAVPGRREKRVVVNVNEVVNGFGEGCILLRLNGRWSWLSIEEGGYVMGLFGGY